MIASWDIPLTGIDPRHIDPSHAHAAVSHWLDDDHWLSCKPWTLAPITVRDGIATLSVTTLTDRTGTTLIDAAPPGRPIRLGHQQGHCLTAPVPRYVTSPDTLINDATANPHMALVWTFRTPTTFRQRNRTTPMPDPTRVVTSATTRWRQLYADDHPGLLIDPDQLADLFVTDIDGHNEVCRINGVTASGFIGRIRYECGTRTDPAAFTALSHFAALAGVGSYTTRGLGHIRIEPTWQPQR